MKPLSEVIYYFLHILSIKIRHLKLIFSCKTIWKENMTFVKLFTTKYLM